MVTQRIKYGGDVPEPEPGEGSVYLTIEEEDLQVVCDILEMVAGETKTMTAAFVGKVLADDDLNRPEALGYVRRELGRRGVQITT